MTLRLNEYFVKTWPASQPPPLVHTVLGLCSKGPLVGHQGTNCQYGADLPCNDAGRCPLYSLLRRVMDIHWGRVRTMPPDVIWSLAEGVGIGEKRKQPSPPSHSVGAALHCAVDPTSISRHTNVDGKHHRAGRTPLC